MFSEQAVMVTYGGMSRKPVMLPTVRASVVMSLSYSNILGLTDI